MQHPLEDPSLTPYGFVTSVYRDRLKYRPDIGLNYERIISKLWAKVNRAKATRPLPAETILHKILLSMGNRYHLSSGDFSHNGLPYLSRDILLLSSIVQWFGTQVGFCFLTFNGNVKDYPNFHPEREFVLKLEQANKRMHVDLVTFCAHECTPHCKTATHGLDSCVYEPWKVTGRDRAVAEALMRWLGTKDGRAFIAKYLALLKNAQNIAEHTRDKENAKLRTSIAPDETAHT